MRKTFRNVLKSKLVEVVITKTDVSCEGSITLGKDLIEAMCIQEFDEVHVNNSSTGDRMVTYVIEGPNGVVELNGAAALNAKTLQTCHVLAYEQIEGSDEAMPVYVHTRLTERLNVIESIDMKLVKR